MQQPRRTTFWEIIYAHLISERHALERFRCCRTGGEGRFRLGNTFFGVSVRFSTSITKKMKVQGSKISCWGFGNMKYPEVEGARGVCRVQFEVAKAME
jgi:hypothetical protein